MKWKLVTAIDRGTGSEGGLGDDETDEDVDAGAE